MTERNYIRSQPPRNYLDWIIGAALVVVAWDKGATVFLLAVIVGGLYFFARPHLFKNTSATISKSQAPAVDGEPDEFVVDQDEDRNCTIDVDVDLNYRPCKNHLRLYHRYDIFVSHSEYEYKVEGTDVSVRLLNNKNEDPDEPEYWDVRDGVVQETTIRERKERESEFAKSLGSSTDEMLEQLKKQTEWCNLFSTSWNGFKYYILSSTLPVADSRRYFRQEIERLTRSEKGVTEAAAKLGFEPREGNGLAGFRTLKLMEGRERPSEELSKSVDLPGVIASLNTTWDEFNSSQNLISQLRQLLGDKPR